MDVAPKLHTLKDAAAYFGRKESTVERWARSGDLPGYKTGGEWRFTDADFVYFLNQGRREPRAKTGDATVAELPTQPAPQGRRQARAS